MGQTARFAVSNLCANASSTACAFGAPSPALFKSLGVANSSIEVGYDWDQVASFKNYMVLDGNVLNMNSYMLSNPTAIVGDAVDAAIRFMVVTMDGKGGKDGTRIFYNQPNLTSAVACLTDRYYAGHIDKITPGCFVSQLFLYFSLVVIMTVVMTRFIMAFVFRWFLAAKLVRPPRNLKRSVISPSVMPEGANIDIGNTSGAAPWSTPTGQTGGAKLRKPNGNGRVQETYAVEKPAPASTDGMISMASIGAELFCVCLVTCYSEGAESIQLTLDSIASTTYSDARKLLFIVCDGIVTGDGEKQSTPDICVGMLERDARFGDPVAMSYAAVGEGSKGNNLAIVHAGHYSTSLTRTDDD